jgi:hypothetical protein
MAGASSEHWFDRLATMQTRRQAIRSSLAAVAALTFPLDRARGARAAGPNDCQKGCIWTANESYHAAMARCDAAGFKPAAIAVYLGFWGGPFNVVSGVVIDAIVTPACQDQAVLALKSSGWDCIQPGCPGFDPTAPGGPCADCHQNCCTCPASTNGYICCAFACDDTNHNCCPA